MDKMFPQCKLLKTQYKFRVDIHNKFLTLIQ